MENELLQKIMKLEESQAQLKQEILKLTISGEHKRLGGDGGAAVDGGGFDAVKLKETDFKNILQSMGQSVHMFDLNGRIIYWNQMAQNLYGYTDTEALGKTAPDIIIGPKYSALATLIIQRAGKGESWSGEFPVRNRNLERFTVITNLSPSHDEHGRINGVLCVCADARPFYEFKSQASVSATWEVSSATFGLDSQQPLQNVIASKLSNLASKVESKIKAGENKYDTDYFSDFAPVDHRQNASAYSTNEHITKNPAKDSSLGSENKPPIHKVLFSKAEAWMGKKGISWPWKRNENENENNQEQENEVEIQHYERGASSTNEAPWSWSSSYGASSSGSTNCNYINKIDIDIDNLDVEVSWDDLIVGDQIGQGLYGTVYHALWYGSEVAVKVFTEQEYPDDVILYFRKEVSLMKRLRHPNILLFMGAVTSPRHLCIVTEFLQRGSLFGLLQLSTTKLDWRRRVHMAMDIARGMNYLHRCQPPIIHRDLKSSNLLVDKNWTVKVGDFGLSRIKRETYLTTMTGKGTPQWMAPEVLRNQQADEKSDVYSYGVVLWEITTGKFPWDNLDSMQVIGAVGFMNQRLKIPKDVDSQWASLIECCWSSEPESRPTFQEILTTLKDLQKKFAVTRRVNRA